METQTKAANLYDRHQKKLPESKTTSLGFEPVNNSTQTSHLNRQEF